MCGINGIAFSPASGRRVEEDILNAMRDVQTHRGPDGEGSFIDGNIGLGHRRLSIVDVEHGGQPMFGSGGSSVLIFNGEIYNHADYREELEADGYEYRTTSDTETIVFLYQKYGFECVEKLRGMFAFAIWDKQKKRLFIARDRIGVKPLYYVHDDEGNLFFGSEIKTLIEAGAVKPEINYEALPDQLANHGTSCDQTLYRHVKRLLPGHFMVWEGGRLDIKKYWDISYEPKSYRQHDSDYVEEWLEEFKKSVRLRLMADVPLGMFLSGGIDSSAICAIMAEMVDEPIKTFSVGFEETGANEFKYARQVAEIFGTDHHEITITPGQFFRELPNLIWHEDEPLGFDASVPLYFVSKLAQKHVKVVLTGEGSDELMAGYGRYLKALKLLEYGLKYEEFAPSAVRNVVRSGVESFPGNFGQKLKRTFLTRSADVESLYFDNFSIFSKSLQERLLTSESKSRIADPNPYRGLQHWFDRNDAVEILDKILYADSKTYLQELLMKQDQMSMAASIESRVPFLDHKLVELTSKMPVRLKLQGKTTKWILRESMRGVLPEVILNRPKMGFPVPMAEWLRGEFRSVTEEFVLSDRSLSRGIFEPSVLREIVDRHYAGFDNSTQLSFLINFEIWNRRMIEGEEVSVL